MPSSCLVHSILNYKELNPDRTEVGGGPAANAAVAVARLGGAARLITPLGDDRLGDELVAELEELGVDTSLVRRVPGARSSLSMAVIDADGERTIVNHTDPKTFAGTSVAGSDLAGSDAVLADSHWPEGAAQALAWARANGKPGVLDFDADADPGLLKHPSHCVLGTDALRAITGEDDLSTGLQAVVARTDAWVAVTAGGDGVFWVEDEKVLHLPAFDVDVVDTLGAGDVFHGALALALGEAESDLLQALRFASGAAALMTTSFGGRTGIPTRGEVDELLAER